jgi:hypothetical protein
MSDEMIYEVLEALQAKQAENRRDIDLVARRIADMDAAKAEAVFEQEYKKRKINQFSILEELWRELLL